MPRSSEFPQLYNVGHQEFSSWCSEKFQADENKILVRFCIYFSIHFSHLLQIAKYDIYIYIYMCMWITNLVWNRIYCHWLPPCQLLNLHIKSLWNAIFQWSQNIIVLLLQCFYDCSFHICYRLAKIKKKLKCKFFQNKSFRKKGML